MEKFMQTLFWTKLTELFYREFNKCNLTIKQVDETLALVSHSNYRTKAAILLDISNNKVFVGTAQSNEAKIEIDINNYTDNPSALYYQVFKTALHYFWSQNHFAQIWNVGDIIDACNFTGLVNQLLHSNYKIYMRSFGWLHDYGNPNTIFWIVRMDGSINGQTPDELWRNTLHNDNDIIIEELVSHDKTPFEKYTDTGKKYYPYRFAFAKNKANTSCEFLGLYRMIDIDRTNYTKTFERIDTTLTMFFD